MRISDWSSDVCSSDLQTEDSEFVFPAGEGDSYFRGYKTPWKKVIEKADLPGVTPHTLRHTMGSTAISSGEAMAFTGAILGHANPRSTAIYAHVQHSPARRAADRVAERHAAALAGRSALEVDAPAAHGEGEQPPKGSQ